MLAQSVSVPSRSVVMTKPCRCLDAMKAMSRSRYLSTSIMRSNAAKIQVIPFHARPAEAIGVTTNLATGLLARKAAGSLLATGWELVKRALGMPNVIPDLQMTQWKPIYLPYWRLDWAATVHSRLDGEEHNLDVTATDIPLAGTHVSPLGKVSPRLPNGEELTRMLEPYEPSKHLSPFGTEDALDDEEAVPDVVPVPFTLFPKALSRAMLNALNAVRNDDIRFMNLDSTIYAAYPMYVPYYLINFSDSKLQDRNVTALYWAADFTKALNVPVTLWNAEADDWHMQFPTNFAFEARAYRKNRPMPVDKPEQVPTSEFNTYSPREAAQAALRSGAVDIGRGQVAKLRKLTEQAGELLKGCFRDVLEELATPNANFPQTDTATINQRLRTEPAFMDYKEHAAGNREYIEKHTELRLAQENLAHTKATPTPKSGERVVSIQRKSRFNVQFQSLTAEDFAKQRDQMIKDAEEKLANASRDVEQSKPAWLSQSKGA